MNFYKLAPIELINIILQYKKQLDRIPILNYHMDELEILIIDEITMQGFEEDYYD